MPAPTRIPGPATTTADPGLRGRTRRVLRRLRRGLLAQRRVLAAVCVAIAVLAGLRGVAAPPPEQTPVLTVTRDLPAGHRLTTEDLTRTAYPTAAVPRGAPTGTAADVAGRQLAAPVRGGEPVTDRALVGPGLAAGHPGLQATPVRLPDAEVAALLRVGQRVDLLAADAEGSRVVAECAPVLALPAAGSSGNDRRPGRVVVLGLSGTEVRAAAPASARSFLSVAFCR